MAPTRYMAVPGSEHDPLPGATQTGPCDPREVLNVTLVLRARPLGKNVKPLGELLAQGERVTRTQYAARYGADPKDVARVRTFARANGLKVANVNVAARTVGVSGPAASFSKAFQVELSQYSAPPVSYLGRKGSVYVPSNLHGVIVAVHGLDNRPQAQPRFRVAGKANPAGNGPSSAWAASGGGEGRAIRRPLATANVSYTAPQVAKLYDFPASAQGAGETIGLIELGGGFTQSDLNSYFSGLGISPAPTVTAVSVDGATNQPTGDDNGPDAEVMLDIEVAGSVAPKAKIAVYFAPNTDAGFLDAINQAVGDKENKPSVISISWGGAESTWSAQSLQSYNSAIEAASAVGVSVCIAAGDDGSTDGVSGGLQHVDFPASSPYALSCGGTSMTESDNQISREVVWNDLPNGGATGGGISATFPLPTWQKNAHVPPSVNPGSYVGRGVPDVAGDADPDTGYQVTVDGSSIVVGGTSAVAPLWAGLIACFNSQLGKSVGYLNPTLYQRVAAATGTFRDITSGNNGAYKAAPGWDACSGWGSPNGNAILQSLESSAASVATKTCTATPTGRNRAGQSVRKQTAKR